MEIIGHESVLKFLSAVRERGTIAHAYLFAGPASVGKTTVAGRFLGELLGVRDADSPDPLAALRLHPDVCIVEREDDPKTGRRKKNIAIDQIRALRHRLTCGSFLDSWKVGVVVEAETLSDEAANAFLKTLEEPVGQTILILLAHSAGALPATVASRCQLVRFRLVSEAAIGRGLIARGADAVRARSLAAIAAGRPGLALSALREPSIAEERAGSAAAFAEVLGAPVWRRLRFAETSAPERGALAAADAAATTLGIWETVLRDALALGADEPALTRHLALRDRLAEWVKKKTLPEILAALKSVATSRVALSENVSPRLALERVLLAL